MSLPVVRALILVMTNCSQCQLFQISFSPRPHWIVLFVFSVSILSACDRRAFRATLDFLDAGSRIVPLVASKSLGECRGGRRRGKEVVVRRSFAQPRVPR